MSAGARRHRIIFSKRAIVDDGAGNPVSGDFADQFTVWTRVQVLKGGEGVLAARLQGTQPVVLSVLAYPDTTKLITTDWRGVDADDATKVYNIRAVTPNENNFDIDLLCEQGVVV